LTDSLHSIDAQELINRLTDIGERNGKILSGMAPGRTRNRAGTDLFLHALNKMAQNGPFGLEAVLHSVS
jgi:hypothetical protein